LLLQLSESDHSHTSPLDTSLVAEVESVGTPPELPLPNAAEICFRQAINTARQQQAKSLELRAAMGLSRLLQAQGKRAEAHQILAEIYDWFTEGFATPDLQEAKALLDALVGAAEGAPCDK
jgi:adenylate cyclase